MCIGIYAIRNSQNNKRYIGYSIDIKRRWQTHKRDLRNNKHENKHLQAAYNKYSADSFIYEIIEECNPELLKEREKYWIYFYDSRKNGYNETDGGDGLINPSDDIREKISNNLRGKNNGMYNVHLYGAANGLYGKKHSEEAKKIMSEKAKMRIGKDSNRAIKVQASTGEIFETMTDAAKWAGCKDPSSISKACKGITKTAGRHPKTKERIKWNFYNK